MPNFTFYEGRKQATTKFFLSLNLNAVPKKSTLEKFAFFRHFHRIRINAKKFEKTPIHFKSDVFAAVAVVDAKTPYYFKTQDIKLIEKFCYWMVIHTPD